MGLLRVAIFTAVLSSLGQCGTAVGAPGNVGTAEGAPTVMSGGSPLPSLSWSLVWGLSPAPKHFCELWETAETSGGPLHSGLQGTQPHKVAVPERLGSPLKASAGMNLGSAPQLGCKALAITTPLLPPSLAPTLPPPPRSSLRAPGRRPVALACDSVWLCPVRRAIFSSPWLYFL